MRFGIGAGPPDQGPITIVSLVRTSGTFGWVLSGLKAGSSVWAMGIDAGKWFGWNDFGSGVSFSPGGHWCYVVMTRGTGVCRFHFQDYEAGGAWSHVDGTFNTGDGSGPADAIQVSGYGGAAAGAHWNGSMATLAAVGSAWSDSQIEARCTNKAVDLFTPVNAETNKWMIRFNQGSVTTTVVDDTGSGGDQTSRTGTTVDTDPPGYDYALTSTVSTTIDLRWSVSQQVSNTIDLRWSISELVSKTADLRWSISQPVTASADLRWTISQAVTNALDLRWSLAEQVVRQLDLRWSVAALVANQLDLRWQVVGQVKANLNLKWSIDGNAPSTPVGAIIINRRTGPFIANKKTSMFKVNRP
jgi:hypothetical protein